MVSPANSRSASIRGLADRCKPAPDCRVAVEKQSVRKAYDKSRMNRRSFVSLAALGLQPISAAGGRTTVSIRGDAFLINGRPTYAGREYKGSKIEGLLMNSRVVQGIFDDSNPETRGRWRYPD